ncbi:hypothetical protein N9L76_05500 [bacterium]|nr:hypothetical protein [bacterium]
MTTAVQPLDLLQIDWPTHLVPEILARLLQEDLPFADEGLARRRLVKGSIRSLREDSHADSNNAEDDLLAFVLRVCLTFAGKRCTSPRKHGGPGSETKTLHEKQTSANAGAWCACAMRVLCRASSPDYARAYRAIREALICFPNLGATFLTTFEREATAKGSQTTDVPFDYGVCAWPFAILAVLSSKTSNDDMTRDAIRVFNACVRAMSTEEVQTMMTTWCGSDEARKDTLEACLEVPAGGASRKALPALVKAWPACRSAVLNAALWGIAHHETCDAWLKVLEVVADRWQGTLDDEQARFTAETASRLQSLLSTSGACAAARVARSITRVASTSGSKACEAVILDEARASLSGPNGDEAMCGLFIASELVRVGEKEASTMLLELGVSHGDARVRRLAFKIIGETLGDSTLARDGMRAAVDTIGLIGLEFGAPAGVEVITEMTRLALRQTRARTNPDRVVATQLTSALLDAFARVKSETSAGAVDDASLRALLASFEVLLDDAARYPSDIVRYFPAVDTNYLVELIDKHVTITEMLKQKESSCHVTLPGCAALLNLTQISKAFDKKHISHLVMIASLRVKHAMARDNSHPDLDADAARAVKRCASYASTVWRAWTSDAEVADGLSLLKECVTFAAATGDARQVRELVDVVTKEDERVYAAKSLVKRAYIAVGKTKRDAIARIVDSSGTCGATAVFCAALLEHFRRAGLDSADGQRVASGFIDVIAALEPLTTVDTSRNAAVVLNASMNAVRDVVFHPRGMPSAISTHAMRILVAHYRRCLTASERLMNLSDLVFEAVPHVARGTLLDATHALVTTFETDLSRSSRIARALDDAAVLDASAATQEVINAVLIHSRMKRNASGSVKDERVGDTIGVPAFACTTVRAARLCLDMTRPQSASSELATAGHDLRRAVELLLRRRILPEKTSHALEPWHREVFFESVEVVERVLRTGATLAQKVRWNDDWPERAETKPVPVESVDLLGNLATTADAVGDQPVEQVEPGSTKKPKKKKLKRKHRNPFVQALRETEGKKARSQEWDDLEDFVVCKPGRNYRKLLGLGDRRSSVSPSRRREDGAPRLRIHERTRELLYEKATAGTLGEPDEGQFYRGTRNAWYCMKCRSCMNPQNRRKCEELPADGKPPGYVEDPEYEEAEEEMAEEELAEGEMAEEEMAEEEMPEEQVQAGGQY